MKNLKRWYLIAWVAIALGVIGLVLLLPDSSQDSILSAFLGTLAVAVVVALLIGAIALSQNLKKKAAATAQKTQTSPPIAPKQKNFSLGKFIGGAFKVVFGLVALAVVVLLLSYSYALWMMPMREWETFILKKGEVTKTVYIGEDGPRVYQAVSTGPFKVHSVQQDGTVKIFTYPAGQSRWAWNGAPGGNLEVEGLESGIEIRFKKVR